MSAFRYAKDSGNFGRNLIGRSVSVSSDRNILSRNIYGSELIL